VLLVSRDVCSRSAHTCVFSMTLDVHWSLHFFRTLYLVVPRTSVC